MGQLLSRLIQCVVAVSLGGAATATIAAGYLDVDGTFTRIEVPGPIRPQSKNDIRYGINNAGQIVGSFDDSAGRRHGFLYADGTLTVIDVPGATRTIARDINDFGHVVGAYEDGNTSHGFLKVGDTFTTIDFPGSTSTVLNGINNAGQIVGDATTSNPDGTVTFDSFVYDDATFSRVDVPGSTRTFSNGINNLGQIVGSIHGDEWLGFIYTDGSYQTLERGANRVELYDINDAGQIVGRANASGFVYDRGRFTGHNVPPEFGYAATPTAINNAGHIVGNYAIFGSPTAPIPEPNSVVLFGVGLSVLGIAWRRKSAASRS